MTGTKFIPPLKSGGFHWFRTLHSDNTYRRMSSGSRGMVGVDGRGGGRGKRGNSARTAKDFGSQDARM